MSAAAKPAPTPKPVAIPAEELAAVARRRALTWLRRGEGLEDEGEDELTPGAPPPLFQASEVSTKEEAPPPSPCDGPSGPGKGPLREAGEEPLPPRLRVRLRLWRHRTTVEAELNADTTETMSWRDPAREQERGPRSLMPRQAIEIAERAVDLPDDCGTPDAVLVKAGEVPTLEVSWVHLVGPDGDVVVEGDKIVVRVNAETGQVGSVFKKWRRVRATPPAE